jgi:hypothetical protein
MYISDDMYTANNKTYFSNSQSYTSNLIHLIQGRNFVQPITKQIARLASQRRASVSQLQQIYIFLKQPMASWLSPAINKSGH